MSDDEFFEKSVMTGTHLLMGNAAMAEGCIAGGCRFFAGYPITPQNEVPERMSRRLPEVGGVFMQMEDEIASISAVMGAVLGGWKAMSSTSGPGFALMQETLSLAALKEIPVVVANVQRVGPGSGVVSLPHHGDISQFKRGGNGDYEVICVAPNSCQELFDLSIEAFNYAGKWRVPTFIMSDAWLGHTHEKCTIPSPDEIKKRIIPWPKYKLDEKPKTIFTTTKDFNEFNIPPFPRLGSPQFPWWMPSVTHSTKSGFLTEDPETSDETVKIVNLKITKNEEKISKTKEFKLDDADIAVVAYGLPSRTAREAINRCRKEGIKVGMLRMVTVWPTPETALKKLAESVKAIVIPEINMGQIAEQVERFACRDGERIPVVRVTHTSRLHKPEEIISKIKEVAA